MGNLCDTRGVEVTEGFPFFINSIDVGWLVGSKAIYCQRRFVSFYSEFCKHGTVNELEEIGSENFRHVTGGTEENKSVMLHNLQSTTGAIEHGVHFFNFRLCGLSS